MTSAKLRLMSLFMSICRPHFPPATIDDALTVPLFSPPGVVRAGLRQRSTKMQARAVGVGGPPMAHDDTRPPITCAAIIKAIDVLTSLSPSRLRSWLLFQPPQGHPDQ